MKKSLVALMLVLVMLMTVSFSACGGKPNVTGKEGGGEEIAAHEHDFKDGRCVTCGETEGVKHALQGGAYLVSGYDGNGKDVYLSSAHDGKAVSGLAAGAFEGNENVINVILSFGITSIGDRAFAGCSALESIFFPNSVKQIGENVFEGCSSLAGVYFQGSEEEWTAVRKAENWASEEQQKLLDTNFGSPWISTIFTGNLPSERPRAQDDLYTYFNYDFLKNNQIVAASGIDRTLFDMVSRYQELLSDPSIDDPELNALRVFYNQLADEEEMKKYGLHELIQPYFVRIDAVDSIADLNELLLADDFWFLPFIDFMFYKESALSEASLFAKQRGAYFETDVISLYHNYTDADGIEYLGDVLWWERLQTKNDLISLGMDEAEAGAACKRVMTFEQSIYDESDYDFMSEDKMEFGDLPLKELIQKYYGADATDSVFLCKKFFENLQAVWTNENLGILKLVVKVSLLMESRYYRDYSVYQEIREQYDDVLRTVDSLEHALLACDMRFTFSDVLAKTFVKYDLGDEVVEKIKGITRDVIQADKDLIEQTQWLSEDAKTKLFEKLDKLRLNILAPEEGYLEGGEITLSPEDSPLDNYLKLKKARYALEAEKVLHQVDVSVTWYNKPPTIKNCFYNPSDNSINIMPGYITKDMYFEGITDVELLGRVGYIVGHEISHGLTGMGVCFNADGEAVNSIFKETDLEKYETLCLKLINYLDTIEPGKGFFLDGNVCYGEMMADILCMEGVIQVMKNKGYTDYAALVRATAESCAETQPQSYFEYAVMDVHPINNIRVNVMYQMQKKIIEYFNIQEGDTMYLAPDARVVIFGADA